MEKREAILVLAPVGRDAQLLTTALSRVGVPSTALLTFPALIEAAASGNAGALLVTAEALSREAIQQLTAVLKKQPEWSDLPILVLVPGGSESSSTGRLEALLHTVPNLTLLERPIRPATLASVAQNALQSRSRQYQVKQILEEKEQTALSLIGKTRPAPTRRKPSPLGPTSGAAPVSLCRPARPLYTFAWIPTWLTGSKVQARAI